MPVNVNRSFCDDITALKDFLRLSRTLVDDTITQNLNNLVLPTRFDPTSTSRPEKKNIRTPIDKHSCTALLDTIFENWDARTSTIDLCLQQAKPNSTPAHHDPTMEEIRARRLDPYSGRQNQDEPILRRTCEQEQGTERIIRDRTWRILRGRCDDFTSMSEDWQPAFNAWASRRATSNAA